MPLLRWLCFILMREKLTMQLLHWKMQSKLQFTIVRTCSTAFETYHDKRLVCLQEKLYRIFTGISSTFPDSQCSGRIKTKDWAKLITRAGMKGCPSTNLRRRENHYYNINTLVWYKCCICIFAIFVSIHTRASHSWIMIEASEDWTMTQEHWGVFDGIESGKRHNWNELFMNQKLV